MQPTQGKFHFLSVLFNSGSYIWQGLFVISFNNSRYLLHFRARKLRTASNRLLLSLLIADFVLLGNCYLTVYQTLKGAPVLGVFGKMLNSYEWKLIHLRIKIFQLPFVKPQISFKGCQYYGFASTLAALAEIWSLAAVSCDRLQAIFHPLDSHKRITKFQVIRQIYISIEEIHYFNFSLLLWILFL